MGWRLALKEIRTVTMKDYFDRRAVRDPEFRGARERLRSTYAFRRALIRARLDTGITQAGQLRHYADVRDSDPSPGRHHGLRDLHVPLLPADFIL